MVWRLEVSGQSGFDVWGRQSHVWWRAGECRQCNTFMRLCTACFESEGCLHVLLWSWRCAGMVPRSSGVRGARWLQFSAFQGCCEYHYVTRLRNILYQSRQLVRDAGERTH